MEMKMATRFFRQVSTGLVLKCENDDVISQYEKYPDQYIPLRVVAPRTTKTTGKKAK